MYYVYILTNKENGVLYTGVTNDIIKRTWEHKNSVTDGFTFKYNVKKLVYFECTTDVQAAIAREKQIKAFRREKKIALINSINPSWQDLFPTLTE